MVEVSHGGTSVPNIDAETRDQTSPVWDMSQERSFLESMLNQRVTFLLVFFSLIMAGSLQAKTPTQLRVIFGLGFIMSTCLLMPILRAQQKVDLIITELYKDPTHPVTQINESANKQSFWKLRLISMRRVVGYVVPSLLVIALLALFMFGLTSPYSWLPNDLHRQLAATSRDVASLEARVEVLTEHNRITVAQLGATRDSLNVLRCEVRCPKPHLR